MSAIKKGDLVMVVKPTVCCGNADCIGMLFKIENLHYGLGRCDYCGHLESAYDAMMDSDSWFDVSRLKKLDPPATGDTKEAYVNLKQPTKETA